MSTDSKRRLLIWSAVLTYWTIKGLVSANLAVAFITSLVLIPACIATAIFIFTGGPNSDNRL